MRAGERGEPRMDQGFMITVFIARAELQMRVQEQPQIVLPLCEYDALIGSIAAENHFVGIQAVVGGGGDAIGEDHSGAKQGQSDQGTRAQNVTAADLLAKQVSGP